MLTKVVLPTLVALALVVATAPSTSAAPPDDACTLVTQAQVSAALGVQVKPGTYVTPSSKKTCTFELSPSPTKDIRSLTISLWDASGYQIGKQVMAAAAAKEGKDPSQAAGSVGGMGDDAYYTSMGDSYTALMVKKGNTVLKVAIYGELPVEKKKSVEKALALQALSKM